MRFSLTRTMTRRLFRDLCDDADPETLLEALEATGLVERVEGIGEMLFAVPAPVRDILGEQYASAEPEGARDFHRRLARWFAGHDDGRHIPVAFYHAAAGRDWGLVDELWFDNVTVMIRKDAALLSEALDGLPADVLAARPSMQVLHDVLPVAAADTDADGRRATTRAFAEASKRLVRQHWDTMSLNELLIVATGYLIQLRLLGQFQDSAAFGDRVNARASVLGARERVAHGRSAWFHLQRGLTYSLLHDDASAVRSFSRAWEDGTGSTDDFVRSHAAASLALIFSLAGDPERARQWLDRHRRLDTRDWPGDYVISVGGHIAAGFLALDRLDDAGVRSELDLLGDGTAPLELWPFIAFLAAQHALHSGRALEALAQIGQAQAAHDDALTDKGAATALMTRARADLLIACGRGDKALHLVDALGGAVPLARVPAARIGVLGGGDAPVTDIGPLTWDAATSTRDRLEMLLLGAVAALRREDSRNVRRLVNQALDLYGDTGILRPFATIPKVDLARLLDLADRGLDPEDARRLAGRRPVYPDALVLIELSEREQSVLEALAESASRQAIADSLFVSVNTVKTQLASIYQKFGSTTRGETLTKARSLEFLPSAAFE